MSGLGGCGVAGVRALYPMLVRLHRVLLVSGRMKRLNVFMPACRGSRRRMTRRDIAERQRHTGCEHAKQIEQGEKPP